MNVLRRFFSRTTDDPPPASPDGLTFDTPDEVNPYLSSDEQAVVFEHLTGWLNALWPMIEASRHATMPIQVGQAAVASVLDVFTSDDTEAELGLMFELVRLTRTFLPDKTDGEDMPGPRDRTEVGERTIDIRPELAAFFDAAFQGEWIGAVRVSTAARKRAMSLFTQLPAEAAGSMGVQFFAAAVLINVSREFSRLNLAHYLDSDA